MRISDWSSDVCSSDLRADATLEHVVEYRHRQPPYSLARTRRPRPTYGKSPGAICATADGLKGFRHSDDMVNERRPASCLAQRGRLRPSRISSPIRAIRSEEHTSELQSLMRISSAVFCL